MVVLVVLLVVGIAAAIAALIVSRRRLAEQIRLTADAERRAAAGPQPLGPDSDIASATPPSVVEQPELDADPEAVIGPESGTEPRAAIEPESGTEPRAAIEPESGTEPGVDAEFPAASAVGAESSSAASLWAMERARSERTWRYSVSLGPDSVSVFQSTDEPLLAALQVEVDAAREEVGTVVHLDAVVPSGMSDEASLLTLRVAQEVLAPVVRQGEQATLHVRADGADILITVTLLDADEQPVTLDSFEILSSASIEPIEGGVRIRNVVVAEPS